MVMATLKWGGGCEENIARSNVPNFENEVCPTLAILTRVVAVVDSFTVLNHHGQLEQLGEFVRL